MDFGFTLKPDHSLERVASFARLAESAGFTYGWLFDSHVLWKEPYVLLTLMAQNTKRMRLGTCVTNPATREPTVTASVLAVLQELSGGRMDLGIGRGDSARRVLGKKPTDLATLEEATNVIRDLCEGREVVYEGTTLRFDWTGKQRLPVWIAGYGPKALELTGRIALVECRIRRRRIRRPFLRDRRGRGAHRKAAPARCHRRPSVQRLSHERRGGTDPRALRRAHHPRARSRDRAGLSPGGLLLRVEATRLRAVSAVAHVAPPPRTVLAAVEEDPLASRRGAFLYAVELWRRKEIRRGACDL